MISILYKSVIILATCSAPQTQVLDGLTWTPEDDKVIKRVEEGCRRHYGETSCLVKIIKTGDKAYRAICRK